MNAPIDPDHSLFIMPRDFAKPKPISLREWLALKIRGDLVSREQRQLEALDRAENDLFDARAALESAEYDVGCLRLRVHSLEDRVKRLEI